MKNNIILITLSPNTHRTSEENLGIGYLKASLEKNNYHVTIIDGWLNEYTNNEVLKEIEKIDNILFVGLSSYMSNTKPTIELTKKLKEKNITVVAGGFGPTFYPTDYLKNGCDIVIRGEGEETIVEVADCLKESKSLENVQNVSFKKEENIIHNEMRPLNDDLDKYPHPSRDTLDVVLKKKSSVNMVTSRGCSGNCEFCSVIAFFRQAKGKVWRTRSIKDIVDEIEELSNNGIRTIKMVDDSFIDGTRDETWAKEFADEIEKRNINVRLRGQIRADKVNEPILYHLKRAGFFSFACGIENGCDSALKRMGKKATKKDNEICLELFKKYNYLVQMGFILFDKETTLEELRENYEFLKKYQFAINKGIFSEMFSAEGTKLNKKLKEEGKLKETNFILNNNKYEIENDIVNEIYSKLKIWHKSHSVIYDMSIDPLTSPKDIDDYEEFYNITLELKKEDLLIFRKLLMDYKTDIQKEILDTNSFYIEEFERVKKLYKKYGLEYNAKPNPFI